MNLHLILFYLIKFTLLVNLIECKEESLVRKCSIVSDHCNKNRLINKKYINLQESIEIVKLSEQTEKLQLRRKNKRSNVNFSARGTKESIREKNLNDHMLESINRHLFNNVHTSIRSNDENQVNKFILVNQLENVRKNQHDKLRNEVFDEKQIEQHNYLFKTNNKHLINDKEKIDYDLEDRHKLEQAGKDALNALKSLFEIELPEEPTFFNERFLFRIAHLIQSLIEELNHIRTRLEQANCRMRLSFRNKRITSDCEPSPIKGANKKEPCNCSDSVIEQEKTNKSKLTTYQIKDLNKRDQVNAQHGVQSANRTNLFSSYIVTKNQTNPLNSHAIKTNNQLKSKDKNQKRSQTIKADHNQLNTTINSLTNESYSTNANHTTFLTSQNSRIGTSKSKSKKETELSKQLGSAIDCFLCKHQWSKCFNVGFKCP